MITLYYQSSWRPAYLHISLHGRWHTLPMTPLTRKRLWHTLTFEGYIGQEFVMTDNAGHWDNPYGGGNYVVSSSRLALQKGILTQVEENSDRILVISDLDGTMIGDSPSAQAATRHFTRFWLARHYFNGSKLVYNTGRSLEEYLSIHDQGVEFLDPDALITCVGSDAYAVNDAQEFELDRGYTEQFAQDNWDSVLVSRLLDRYFSWLIKPEIDVYAFKVWRIAKIEDLSLHLQNLTDFFENASETRYEGKILKCKVIISGSGSHRYIDITHRDGGKYAGVQYAQRHFHISPNKTLVAGDSGNDIDMFIGDELGVVVSNCQPDLDNFLLTRRPANKYKSTKAFADAIVEAANRLSQQI